MQMTEEHKEIFNRINEIVEKFYEWSLTKPRGEIEFKLDVQMKDAKFGFYAYGDNWDRNNPNFVCDNYYLSVNAEDFVLWINIEVELISIDGYGVEEMMIEPSVFNNVSEEEIFQYCTAYEVPFFLNDESLRMIVQMAKTL